MPKTIIPLVYLCDHNVVSARKSEWTHPKYVNLNVLLYTLKNPSQNITQKFKFQSFIAETSISFFALVCQCAISSIITCTVCAYIPCLIKRCMSLFATGLVTFRLNRIFKTRSSSINAHTHTGTSTNTQMNFAYC